MRPVLSGLIWAAELMRVLMRELMRGAPAELMRFLMRELMRYARSRRTSLPCRARPSAVMA